MKFVCSAPCVGILYAVFSLLWIFFSDLLLESLAGGTAQFAFISMVKGSAFVMASALVLFLLVRWNESVRKKTEERYLRFVENAPDLIYRYRFLPVPGFEYVSPSATRITGYSPKEHYADPNLGLRLVHPEDKPGLEQMLSAREFDKPLTLRWIRKDGRIIWTEQHNVPVYDSAGSLVAVEGIARDITDRMMQESALRVQSAALESTANGVVITDNAGIIVWANSAFTSMTGYAREEAVGRNPRFLSSGEQDRSFYETLWTTILSGKMWRGQLVNRRKDGSTYIEDMSITPVHDHQGSISHFIAIKEDATERIRAQELLIRSEQRHRELIEQASDGIILADKGGRILMVNKAAAGMIGYTPEELYGLTVADTYPEEDREEAARRLRALDSRGQLRFERRIRRKDGTVFPVEVSVRVLADGTSQGIIRDITERKTAEAVIHEQAALLDVVPDAIIIRDLENQIRYWNKGAESIYGWTSGEVVGRSASGILYPAEKDRFRGMLEELMNTGDWEGELDHVGKSGRELTVRSRSRLIRDAEGRPISILSVNTDITRQKSIESQLLRAQRLESLGTLAGGIAHDLNNVLAPILLAFDSIRRRVTDEKAAHVLSVAESSALRGKQIVSQVLTFARGFELAKGPLQLRHVLKEIEQIVKETFPKSIEVKTVLGPDLPMISGDVTQIHQVLMNLVVNARDAMPRGGVLTIGATRVHIDEAFASMRIGARVGLHVVLEIRDTGEGIPKENLERIFDPFFTTKGVGKGTGLGLSTVHSIVTGHGGFIDVQSAPGQGTSFRIYLQAIDGSDVKAKQNEGDQQLQGSQELILVVDDEISIREITSQTLESYGYRCVVASDGVEGVSKLAMHKEEVSLVIMDLLMPVMDGPSAIRAMKKMKPDVKIIVSSGNMPGETEPADEFGVDSFLPKPYTAERLLATIKDVLKNGKT